jgi:hypothetical protein
MQQLKTFVIDLKINNKQTKFHINEKDMDDSICYDAFADGIYLLSVSPNGEILYKTDGTILNDESTKLLVDEIKKKV